MMFSAEYKRYLDEQKKCGLRKGDYVIVKEISPPFSRGWNCGWTAIMNQAIGQVCKIRKIDDWGVALRFKLEDRSLMDQYAYFPWFVLEKDISLDNKHNLHLDV